MWWVYGGLRPIFVSELIRCCLGGAIRIVSCYMIWWRNVPMFSFEE